MEIRKRTVASVTVISLVGELDGHAAAAAKDKILPLLPIRQRILFDLVGVTYVSSAGLRILLLIYRQAQCVNSSVALVGLSEELRWVLSVTGFLRFFVIADNLADGVRALSAAGQERSGVA
ncbi:anti-sigma factor antagonist [Kutzneria chonburiensis]|uniref:Anti-sigma factor antagonist n=1 Tax=Kutzneria chonburiensis TaxID=1483604 RepID=A0ABV6MXH6_9PSEU|nr:anti-sigma factor antagonist [Kutzneria chonburiensis]